MSDASKYHTVMHPEEFEVDWKSFYEKIDRLTEEVRMKVPHHLDIPYGKNPKQRLDIYLPKKESVDRPVFIFLHGGGFREGDRAHYGYIAGPFCKYGIVTVVASYRLTPEFTYPDQPEDVYRIVEWVSQNIVAYNGDPEQIYIGGHSAGALLASFVSVKDGWWRPFSLTRHPIRGLASVSVGYDLRKEEWVDEYLSDETRRAEASPILNMENAPPRAVIAVGTVRSPEENMVQPSRNFALQLHRLGCEVELIEIDGADHKDTVLALADEDSVLFRTVLRMVSENVINEMIDSLHQYYPFICPSPCSLGAGREPAVLVIDFMRGFTEEKSPMRGRHWHSEIHATKKLVDAAHQMKVPVIYSVVEYSEKEPSGSLLGLKTPWIAYLRRGSAWSEIHPSLPVIEDDIILRKKYGSVFFGTDLVSQLMARSIDTLLICGCVTSGCVRASAVDASQYGFRPLVVREAVGDRSALAHEANLLDIAMRYGDIVTLKDAINIVEQKL